MKNNSEIVNNTMCKSCLREHKEMTGHEPIDCAFKAFDNEYCEEAQELADYITNQDTKWQKSKEWIEGREKKHTLMLKASAFEDIEILNKMQELEGEDE